jgi:anthranilate phosphoribosyltransferase
MSLIPYLHCVADRVHLGQADAYEAMSTILEGQATGPQIAAFLVALRMKGEAVDELVGFASAMRQKACAVDAGSNSQPLLDTCGTGGDGASTFNISTVAALVVAGAGARVAKHGNRSISSRCGSADLMEALGVNVALTPEQAGRSIREVGIGFLFAPAIHVAMKYAQPVRVELKMRTVFNLLGPLTNPAGATAQLAGAPSPAAAELMAGALARLGMKRGFVVHGCDGLDEITTTGPTLVFDVREGTVVRRTLSPGDFGVPFAAPAELKGGDVARNCEIARAVLTGMRGPQRDIVTVNSSAALVACGIAADFREGVRIAEYSIDSGAALRVCEELARFTQQFARPPQTSAEGAPRT